MCVEHKIEAELERVVPVTIFVASMGPALFSPRPRLAVFFALLLSIAHALFTFARGRIAWLHAHSSGPPRAVISALFLAPLVWSSGNTFPGWIMAVPIILALPFVTRVGQEWSVLALICSAVALGRYLAGVPLSSLCAGLIAFAATAVLATRISRLVKKLLDSLDAANTAKSLFLANMSHELRTPLAGMISLNELAQAAEPQESTKALIKTAQTSGQHLLAILNDILDLSKIEAGKLELENLAFDVQDCFRQVVAIADASAQAKELSIETEAVIDGEWRFGDRTRIRQVMLNLISNAVKFSSKGSIHISVRADAYRALFVVRDCGVGISPEHLERLYEPFSQADAGTSRTYGGTGLGLSICKHLVEAMGGSLQVASVLGEGTTISFDIPLPRAPAPVPVADTAIPVDSRKLRILVAEDNQTNQLIIRKMLEGLGHDSVMVEDGDAAIDAFVSSSFDVVLMDVQMPKRDGLAATRAIRKRAAGEATQVPIIGLTANAMRGDAEIGLKAGMTDYLVKPVARRALQDALWRATNARCL